jgi:hypothetical protein
MKVQTLFIGILILALLAAVGFIVHLTGVGFIRGSNPPVIISGGSILGNAPGGWSAPSGSKIYSAQTQDNGAIYTSAVYVKNASDGYDQLPQPFTTADAWELKIFDRNAQNQGQPNPGVLICTNPGQQCNGTMDTTTIYAQPGTPYSWLVLDSTGKLVTYYSTDLNCDKSSGSGPPSGPEGPCDHIDHMEFDDLATGAKTRWECGPPDSPNTQGKCQVWFAPAASKNKAGAQN